MKVILLERVGRMGRIGDEVTVKDGFARNFLLPQQKALRATEANRKRWIASSSVVGSGRWLMVFPLWLQCALRVGPHRTPVLLTNTFLAFVSSRVGVVPVSTPRHLVCVACQDPTQHQR